MDAGDQQFLEKSDGTSVTYLFQTCQRYITERKYYNDDPDVDFLLYDNLMTQMFDGCVTGVHIKNFPSTASESQCELEKEGAGRVRRTSIDSRGQLVINLNRGEIVYETAD